MEHIRDFGVGEPWIATFLFSDLLPILLCLAVKWNIPKRVLGPKKSGTLFSISATFISKKRLWRHLEDNFGRLEVHFLNWKFQALSTLSLSCVSLRSTASKFNHKIPSYNTFKKLKLTSFHFHKSIFFSRTLTNWLINIDFTNQYIYTLLVMFRLKSLAFLQIWFIWFWNSYFSFQTNL